ncbi:hypothetical protein, partial [Nocardia brasiliensis]|uniref:hypothetical protein n=1 Tax=Nocardia brasiliensis TaxID=37326 RepID=UPI0024573D8A
MLRPWTRVTTGSFREAGDVLPEAGNPHVTGPRRGKGGAGGVPGAGGGGARGGGGGRGRGGTPAGGGARAGGTGA